MEEAITTTYATTYGEGVLTWRGGRLLGHRLPRRDRHGHGPAVSGIEAGLPQGHAALAGLLSAYFAGEVVTFDLDALPLRLEAMTDFEQRVARELAATAHGELTSYGRLAARAGRPRACRAVGNFMARNPYPVIIPCHRVIRADGALGGFSAGPRWKRILIEMEQAAHGAMMAEGRQPLPDAEEATGKLQARGSFAITAAS